MTEREDRAGRRVTDGPGASKVRVLVVAYAYPPYPIVGAIRPAKLVERLRRAGHEVHVLTARLPEDAGRFRIDEPGYRVEAVPTWPHPKDAYRWLLRKLGRRPAPADGEEAAQPRFTRVERWRPPDHTPRWKRYILSALHVPDELQGFIPPAVRRGLAAFPGGPDLVYTTSPPASAHLAGLLLKRLTRARWAAELRDPWIGNTATESAGRRIRSRGADAANRWLERRCLLAADHIVTVTEGARASVASRLPAPERGKLVVALNGLDRVPAVGAGHGDPEGPFRVVYLGGLSGRRDPRPVLEALAALRRERDLDADDLRLDLVGQCRYHGDVDVGAELDRLGLADLVEIRDWVPHDEAQRLQGRADLLLLLAQDQPIQVPNKLYEYLGAGVPVLALADGDGESARLLRHAGGHYLVTERDKWETLPALRSAHDAYRAGRRFRDRGPDPDVLRGWTTEAQFGRLLEELGL